MEPQEQARHQFGEVSKDLSARLALEVPTDAPQQRTEGEQRHDDFLAMLAHEVRNPLSPICNALHIMKRLGVNDPIIEHVREMMERQVHHMTRLVDALQDLSGLHGGNIELHREVVDLTVLAKRVIEESRPLIEDRQQELTVLLPLEHLTVNGDPVRLGQVIGTLLSNAARYTSPGGHIQLTVERGGSEVLIRVQDSGMGMGTERLTRICDLLAPTKSRLDQTQVGRSLGLALVQGLLALHGGSVQASSADPGQGSEFLVRLPALPEKPGQWYRETLRGQTGPIAVAPKRRILVVDDQVDEAESFTLMLRLEGHEVRVAHDGPAALSAARTYPVDLILVDLEMLGTAGDELGRKLRQESTRRGVVLVALTGWGEKEDRRRSQEAGFDHHLVKPVEPEVLQQLLSDPRWSANPQAVPRVCPQQGDGPISSVVGLSPLSGVALQVPTGPSTA